MMRNSNLSSSYQSVAAFSCPEDQEESGWTSYFDDFFSNKTSHLSSSKHMDNMAYIDDEESDCSSRGGSGSAVSDAASCAAWNESQYKNCDERLSNRKAEAVLAACSSFDGTQMVIHKKLRFKRNINRHKRSSDYYDDSLEDTASSPVNSPKAKGEVYGYDHQRVVEDNKSLKEKGLCLVPYSMLMNYIG